MVLLGGGCASGGGLPCDPDRPELNVATVIPVGHGREENLTAVLESLTQLTVKPKLVVLVCDGPEAWRKGDESYSFLTAALNIPKHEPGMEQPRNAGVRLAQKVSEEKNLGITHVWFLDSDCIVAPETLEAFLRAEASVPEFVGNRILIGPYDWLPPGVRHPMPELRNDPEGVPPPGRWGSFDRFDSDVVVRGDLSAGLACFSGNLIWPIEDFIRVGGFWNELHHGRCEDGELGLRAVHMGVPIGFVRDARAWHLFHDRNMGWIANANLIDVPKLNARHPWVELGEGGTELFVVDEDGKRFNARCSCGWEGNTALIFGHQATECPDVAASEDPMELSPEASRAIKKADEFRENQRQ